MQSEFAADPRGDDRRIELTAASLLHFARDAKCGSARRILLLRVVALFHTGSVLRKSREHLARAAGEGEDDVRTRREVRGVRAADSSLLDALAKCVERRVPAGGP